MVLNFLFEQDLIREVPEERRGRMLGGMEMKQPTLMTSRTHPSDTGLFNFGSPGGHTDIHSTCWELQLKCVCIYMQIYMQVYANSFFHIKHLLPGARKADILFPSVPASPSTCVFQCSLHLGDALPLWSVFPVEAMFKEPLVEPHINTNRITGCKQMGSGSHVE